jgi:hypothetical protein
MMVSLSIKQRSPGDKAKPGPRGGYPWMGKGGHPTLLIAENQRKSPVSGAVSEVGRAGIEPATHGFSVHCSTS